MRGLAKRIFLTWLVALLGVASARADQLDSIAQRGEVVIGVKTDYPPFGQLNAGGEIIGFEPTLAADLAKRLGARLRLVAVTSANRLQKLQDGTVDILIATLGDTQQRREIATLIEPNYYASGINIMLPRNSTIHDWSDLLGRTVCGTQGQYANRLMQQRYLLQMRLLNTNRDAMLALRKDDCAGWLQDDTLIRGELASGEWPNHAMPLRSVLLAPWSIAISDANRGSRLERFISDTVADWHRGGFLVRTERAAGLPPSSFLHDAYVLWNQRTPDGQALCRRDSHGMWPEECRNKALISSSETTGIERLGLQVKESTGLDFSFIYDHYDRWLFLGGLLTTFALLIVCLLGSLAVGLAGAFAVLHSPRILGWGVQAVLTVSRMTPPLLQVYVVFFGIGSLIQARFGISLPAIIAVEICLSCYAGAAIAQALIDASAVLRRADPGFVLGWKSLPRTAQLAQGPVIGSLVNVVKACGIASVIAVPEIISVTTAITSERGNFGVMMNVLMAVYFFILMAVVRALNALQRRLPTS
jgi:polar amino acid transport system substrate-binding protein